MAIIIL